jgi:hypothetical protein
MALGISPIPLSLIETAICPSTVRRHSPLKICRIDTGTPYISELNLQKKNMRTKWVGEMSCPVLSVASVQLLNTHFNLPQRFSLAFYKTCCCHVGTMDSKVLLVLRMVFTEMWWTVFDRLCSLVVRVPGYRSRASGFDSERHQIF